MFFSASLQSSKFSNSTLQMSSHAFDLASRSLNISLDWSHMAGRHWTSTITLSVSKFVIFCYGPGTRVRSVRDSAVNWTSTRVHPLAGFARGPVQRDAWSRRVHACPIARKYHATGSRACARAWARAGRFCMDTREARLTQFMPLIPRWQAFPMWYLSIISRCSFSSSLYKLGD